MRIAVLGAGAWGTALAVAAAASNEVLLWARDAQQLALMRAHRRNARYLPEVALPARLVLSDDRAQAIAWCAGQRKTGSRGDPVGGAVAAAVPGAAAGLIVIATPMSGLRTQLQALPPELQACWLCKGFEAGSGALGHELARELRPQSRLGILSGPSFAIEVARGQPTAMVAASDDPALAALMVQAFHTEALRVYTSDDPVGVEVGGAVKNVMAIATGVADGLGLGQNARAALITRGLAEMTRLALAMGGQVATLMGLSGLGDLVLTATGDLSRNRRVGLLLAQGHSLADILQQLGHVAEGVYSAATVLARARALGVDMPITAAVVALLGGRVSPAQALQALMSREARAESV